MSISITGRTHVGQHRGLNEDTFAWSSDETLDSWVSPETLPTAPSRGDRAALIVADGMGGAMAGEVASALARDTMQQWLQDAGRNLPENEDELIALLRAGLLHAHERILDDAARNRDRQGMGTTLVTALIERGKLFAVWSGDSRIYRFSPAGPEGQSGCLQMLSDDHSMVWELVRRGELSPEEARLHPHSNIITQSLGGAEAPPEPDFRVADLSRGDIILCCTDGLNGMLSDQAIEDIFRSSNDLDTLAEALITAANAAGGHDNITVVLARVAEGPERPVSLAMPVTEEAPNQREPRDTAGGAAFKEMMTPKASREPSQAGRRPLRLILPLAILGLLAYFGWNRSMVLSSMPEPTAQNKEALLVKKDSISQVEKESLDVLLSKRSLAGSSSTKERALVRLGELLISLDKQDSLLSSLPPSYLVHDKKVKPTFQRLMQLVNSMEKESSADDWEPDEYFMEKLMGCEVAMVELENKVQVLLKKYSDDKNRTYETKDPNFNGPPVPKDTFYRPEPGALGSRDQ